MDPPYPPLGGQNGGVDEDFLDLIDQAILEAQIDGTAMALACSWLECTAESYRDQDLQESGELLPNVLPN